MDESKKDAGCCGLLPYLNEEGSRLERKRFERHLAACDDCRRELAELLPLWRSMPRTLHKIRPPYGLKKQVLGAIFGRWRGRR